MNTRLVIALSVVAMAQMHCIFDPQLDSCKDIDGDGYGVGLDCHGDDCDDGDAAVHPGAVEICDDGLDNDCDGQTDDGDPVCRSESVADPQGTSIGPWNGYLALGSDNVYFSYAGKDDTGGSTNGGVAMASKTDFSASCVACDQGMPREVTTDETSVYWTDIGIGALRKAPLGGGTVVDLRSGTVGTPLAVCGSHVFWFDAGSDTVMKADRTDGANPLPVAGQQVEVNSIACDATNVYWTSQGSVMTRTLGGSDPVALARREVQPRSIAVDVNHVYWAAEDWNDRKKTIRRVKKNGSELKTVASFSGAWAIALDDAHVYCAGSGPDVEDRTIWRVAKGGGPIEILAANQPYPFDIAVDDTHVYWSSETDGGVDRIAK